MRMLMHIVSGWVTYATLRATQLGARKRQVLVLVGSLAVTAVKVCKGHCEEPFTLCL